jgi:hypothetical protein
MKKLSLAVALLCGIVSAIKWAGTTDPTGVFDYRHGPHGEDKTHLWNSPATRGEIQWKVYQDRVATPWEKTGETGWKTDFDDRRPYNGAAYLA